MKLLSSMIDENNYMDSSSERLYPIDRVYVSKLVRFVSHLPRNLDKSNHIQEICEPYLVLVYHETASNYIDIETGEKLVSDNKSAVFYNKNYRPNKLYVSRRYKELFKGRCYYTLREKGLLDKTHLTAKEFRDVLDAELTWEDTNRRGY
jgi:hypothetical protein